MQLALLLRVRVYIHNSNRYETKVILPEMGVTRGVVTVTTATI